MMGGAKRKILLGAAGLVLAVLILVPAFLLYQGISRFSDTETRLKRSVAELKQHYARDPFPARENVERLKESARVLDEWYDSLVEALSEGQKEVEDKSPTAFMGLLSDVENRLEQIAGKRDIKIPEGFAFGFERYDGGIPPSPDDVPRLTQQLAIVELVSRVLFAAGVDELNRVRREEFEKSSTVAAPAARGSSRTGRRRSPRSREPEEEKPAARAASSELYDVLHFGVQFKAGEEALLKALNLLARVKVFVVVSSLELQTQGPDIGVRIATGVEGSGGLAGAERAVEVPMGVDLEHLPPRRERLVCGPRLAEPMVVNLEMDVYRFGHDTGT